MSAEQIDDKLAKQKSELEIEKLKAEIRVAKRSPWFAPTTLLTAVITFVAVGGYIIQHSLLNFDLRQAQLDKTRLDNDLSESRNEKKHLDEENERLKTQLESQQNELAKASAELAMATSRFNGNILSFGKIVPLGQDIKVEGVVINSDGQPVPNASVHILRIGSKYVPAESKEIITSPEGNFSYSMPSGPSFILYVYAAGMGMNAYTNLAGDCDQRLRVVVTPSLGSQLPSFNPH